MALRWRYPWSLGKSWEAVEGGHRSTLLALFTSAPVVSISIVHRAGLLRGNTLAWPPDFQDLALPQAPRPQSTWQNLHEANMAEVW